MERVTAGHGNLHVERLADGTHRITDPHGSFTVDVRTARLSDNVAARSTLDHENGSHVIELSRHLDSRHVDRAIAHELGEIAHERRLRATGELPPNRDTLRSGEFEPGSRLSPHDAGRVQELRVLAEQYSRLSPNEAISLARVRSEGLALVDHLGIRDGTPGATERRGLINDLLTDNGRTNVNKFLEDVGRPEHDLPPADRQSRRTDADDGSDHTGRDGQRDPERPEAERSDRPDDTDRREPTDESTRDFKEFYGDLYAQAEIEAGHRGTSANDELQQFAIQRVLARFFAENPDNWVLKGGQSLLARHPGSRASSDLDFTRTAPDDPDNMVRDYERALARDLGDHLTFVQESRQPLLNGTGVRLSHDVYLGDRPIMTLGVDLAPPPTRPVWREPDVVSFPERALSTGAEGATPDLRVISLHDTLAHKVSGMYTYGRRTLENKCHECTALGKGQFMCKSGDPPYRSQDLVDVLMLARHSSWDARETHAMLREEFAWRLAQGENLRVPERFEVPNPAWERTFARYVATTPGLPYMSLQQALPLARAFLDPLLSNYPPDARWDPKQLRWVDKPEPEQGKHDAPGSETEARPGDARDTDEQPPARSTQLLERTGDAPPSRALAEQSMIDRWDALAGDRNMPGSVDAFVDELKARTDLTLQQKLQALRDLMADVGYDPSEVTSLDSKNLRVYAHQRGELYIHSAALMADGETTVEIAYQPDRTVETFRWEAHQAHVAHLGTLPEGMRADQANAVAHWRAQNGRLLSDVTSDAMARDLIDMQAHPLRDALKMRQRLIDDHSIDPSRIRLAHAGGAQQHHYSNTRWVRAHLLTLDALRENPDELRQAMVDAMTGQGEQGRIRERRAQDVVDRLSAATSPPPDGQGDRPRQKYALLWVRDSRDQPVGSRHGPHLDTRPEMVRQTIEALRESHPDVRPVLLGGDLFARRPELRESWDSDNVLDGVDTDTLVNFWEPERNGGQGLSHGEQALFFHRLTQQHDVVQIGMESGAMEMPAVLGTPTVYLEAREHDGNKGNRWALYWQDWAHGQNEDVLDTGGRQRFDDSGQPITRFAETEVRPAPLASTVERVLYGPDLPDPTDRRGQPTAVYLSAKVSVTADQIVRLVDSGELDRWSERLGRSAELDSAQWQSWTEQDWERSQYYTDQLHRWLQAEVSTPEEAGRKWDGIRLALTGIVEPGFDKDEQYEGSSIVYPYFLLHNEQSLPVNRADQIREAFAADPGGRAAAVTQVLKDLLGDPGFRRQAVDDMRVFGFESAEIEHLRAAMDRVMRDNQ